MTQSSQTLTIAFDVYGTLIDTQGVLASLEAVVGDRAGLLSETWRSKQLEYSFRRGLMRRYVDFATCTSHALDFACQQHGVSLSAMQKQRLFDSYRNLPAFNDVRAGLTLLVNAKVNLYAFSNGSTNAVQELLHNAGIRDLFLDTVSCDDVMSFKPNPDVYTHFLTTSKASVSSAWLVSSNPFDVIGAMSAGMQAVWVQRSSAAVFDPWGMEPTLTISSLNELYQELIVY
ncbi:haloacid dehalogenase type II [Arenicella xantha]|uniref:(S)-2-haloacid dehalogenase n=1 Tax=Arenicella xantha TaxID=644221 RepID=A0A395JK38_9GAMM|nr:haloacid dehalogenase type II [Arenicella xantha]RBP51092.1 2-haloacid dehalogenase [Arenicella xantha]